jgi:hypothetical protein
MDSSKCYNRKKDRQYLGKFVRTENYYPDGPDRGGSTDHYFIKDGAEYKVGGYYNDSDRYEETPCTGNVVLKAVTKPPSGAFRSFSKGSKRSRTKKSKRSKSRSKKARKTLRNHK